MAASAAPWIIGGVSALGSSAGSKKAAKEANKGPSIPSEFRPAVLDATNLLGQRMRQGFPSFRQPSGDVITGLQGAATGSMGSLLGQGDAAFQTALRTAQDVAATGMDPAQVEFVRQQLSPFFNRQFQQGLAQTRESQATGGRFFGSGGVTAEGDFTNQFLANQSATILPLAMQIRQLQLQGAQSIPDMFARQMGGNALAFDVGEKERLARLGEFMRTQPENAIPLLASLMGGTPMYQPTVPTNFLQALSGAGNSLVNSPGFWQYLQGMGGGSASSAPSAAMFNPFTGKFDLGG